MSYSKEINLHYLNVNEATPIIYNSLLEFKNDNFIYELNIITGKGTGALKLTVLEILDKDFPNLKYIEQNNGGSILVRKFNNDDNDDELNYEDINYNDCF
ncbi:MAG: Smr/MutS family protein [Metamycoplasmataceae bacterium]